MVIGPGFIGRPSIRIQLYFAAAVGSQGFNDNPTSAGAMFIRNEVLITGPPKMYIFCE